MAQRWAHSTSCLRLSARRRSAPLWTSTSASDWRPESSTPPEPGDSMKGDFSRTTFHAPKHFRAVLMQQGRVQVDADWNEQQAIVQHRTETEAVDVIGHCGAPTDAAGFRISTDGTTLTIGPGR